MKRYFPNFNLLLLWLGQFVSLSGDYVYRVGIYWYVLAYSDSTFMTGLVGACFFLPTLLFGLQAGAVADRTGYRKTMALADLARLGLVLIAAIAFGLGWTSTPLLMLVAIGVAIGGTFFNPARDALIPEIAPAKAHLVQVNAVQQSAWPFSLLCGALLAWGTISHPTLLFSFDAFTFLISLGCILAIAHRWGPGNRYSSHRPTLWKDLGEGLRYAVRDKRIRALLALTSLDNLFIMGPAEVGLAIFVKQRLKLPGMDYALMESAYGFGMILSMFVIHQFADRLPKGKLLLYGMILDGITYIPMYWSHSFFSTYLIFFIHSWAIPMIIIGRTSLIQTLVPEGMRGRLFSLVNITVFGMIALSNLLTGLAAEMIPIHLLFALIGIGGALCGLWGMLYRPLRES